MSTAWDASTPLGFLCECGDRRCAGVIQLSLADYEAVRSAADSFLVLGGHEHAFDAVVARINGYAIVQRQSAERAA